MVPAISLGVVGSCPRIALMLGSCWKPTGVQQPDCGMLQLQQRWKSSSKNQCSTVSICCLFMVSVEVVLTFLKFRSMDVHIWPCLRGPETHNSTTWFSDSIGCGMPALERKWWFALKGMYLYVVSKNGAIITSSLPLKKKSLALHHLGASSRLSMGSSDHFYRDPRSGRPQFIDQW